jgi:acetamidase/formamidase
LGITTVSLLSPSILSINWKYPTILDSDDVKNVNLNTVHNLSGPVAVEGAEPGDCLVVDILDGELMHCADEKLNLKTFSYTFREDALGLYGISFQ